MISDNINEIHYHNLVTVSNFPPFYGFPSCLVTLRPLYHVLTFSSIDIPYGVFSTLSLPQFLKLYHPIVINVVSPITSPSYCIVFQTCDGFSLILINTSTPPFLFCHFVRLK